MPKKNDGLKETLRALFKAQINQTEKTIRHIVYKSKKESKIYDSICVQDLATLENFDEVEIFFVI